MIELSFIDFYNQNYENEDFQLYIMKNGLGDILYSCGHWMIVLSSLEMKFLFNRTYNYSPSRDTTPKSEKEKDWENYKNQAYDEIFNKKK